MLVDSQGNEVGPSTEYDCMIGTEMLGIMVACKIDVPLDEYVHKFKLYFGSTTYETRVPSHEVNDMTKQNVWKDMLTRAFAAHEIGKAQRGMISSIANAKVEERPQSS